MGRPKGVKPNPPPPETSCRASIGRVSLHDSRSAFEKETQKIVHTLSPNTLVYLGHVVDHAGRLQQQGNTPDTAQTRLPSTYTGACAVVVISTHLFRKLVRLGHCRMMFREVVRLQSKRSFVFRNDFQSRRH